MNRHTILASLTVALGVSALLLKLALSNYTLPDRAPPPTPGADPVVQQFERELNREPGPLPPPARESIDDDQLYQQVNAVHWTTEEESQP